MNRFNDWNQKKQSTHSQEKLPEFYDREIWWVQFGQNIATEIYGKGDDFLRPAIVIRKVFDDACLVIPVTSKEKKGSYYFHFKDQKKKDQWAILTQVRYIDARRLKHRFGKMKRSDFEKIKQSFSDFIHKK